jgi:peroxiredoxin Q/BCP
VAAQAKFAKGQGFTFGLLADTERDMGLKYGACTSKSEFANRITYLIGPDGRILERWPKVSPREHPREVLAALRAVSDRGGAGGGSGA